MKNLLASIVLALFVSACATSQKDGSDQVAQSDSGAKTKKVCETVRTNQTGQRIKRVCREVPVEGS